MKERILLKLYKFINKLYIIGKNMKIGLLDPKSRDPKNLYQ